MAYRWHPKDADVDPELPRAWATCDRCGFVTNLNKLQFQFGYQGAAWPQNSGFLVCDTCLDPLNPQDAAWLLPPDPMPVFNARPEPYAVDETNWLVTQDGNIIDTQDGDPLITTIPNPASNANTAHVAVELDYPGGSIATVYLDLFDGDPTNGGRSVLASITGSSTRANVASQMATAAGVAINTSTITLTTSSQATTNVNYVALYSASISGALLASAPASVSKRSVALGVAVVFDAEMLVINLS